jgi:hypothetical protein
MSEKPPKKRRPKLKRLNISTREKWNRIIKEVEKKEVPVNLIDSISVNLIDGTVVDINIKELLIEGMDPEDIEKILNEKLSDLDHIIEDVDFYVSVDDVANTVQPITDNFLKNL